MGEGATTSMFQYTLFCYTKDHKQVWANFQGPHQPHTDILLHVNSATGINKTHTIKFSCRGYTPFTTEEYTIPAAKNIAANVYHPSGLYPHKEEKPKFI